MYECRGTCSDSLENLQISGHLMMPSGESLGSSNLPFRGAKCTLYEGGVRTPAFIKIPHLITSGKY